MTAARLLRPTTAAVLVLLVGLPSFVRAETEKIVWEPARTSSPTSLVELRALEAQIKVVVDKAMPSTVSAADACCRIIAFSALPM